MQQTYGKKPKCTTKPQPMFTIFIQAKPVIICSRLNDAIRQQITDEQLILLNDPDIKTIPALVDKLEDDSIHGYVWESPVPDSLLKSLMDLYEHWQAAGGLITNPAGDILLMFRRGKWDLPKGKIDSGETPETAALREVTEETGLHTLHIERQLTDTWHAYHQFGKNIIKQTYWFKMNFTGTELTVPQIEEDIQDIQWIKPENIGKYLPYSYPNLKAVFRSAGYENT
jgi:8-oxo-dGTP pyrophosphatase MutT (NUDIX family)